MNNLESKSKYLALLLRHKPEKANLQLDKNGWCDVIELINNANFSIIELENIVKNDNKSRYEFSSDNKKIRAVQGHSNILNVDLQLEKIIPPPILYHGTKEIFLEKILKEGLLPMNRQHVHLTDNIETAKNTADRRKGKSIILSIDTMHMKALNFNFYKANNGVFLCDNIPPKFIKIL